MPMGVSHETWAHPVHARHAGVVNKTSHDASAARKVHRVHYIIVSWCGVDELEQKTPGKRLGYGQKNGEGVAAALPRKERRTLWKAARSTSSTPHPYACHRFPAAKVFACDHDCQAVSRRAWTLIAGKYRKRPWSEGREAPTPYPRQERRTLCGVEVKTPSSPTSQVLIPTV